MDDSSGFFVVIFSQGLALVVDMERNVDILMVSREKDSGGAYPVKIIYDYFYIFRSGYQCKRRFPSQNIVISR